jgi:hypothetical protein
MLSTGPNLIRVLQPHFHPFRAIRKEKPANFYQYPQTKRKIPPQAAIPDGFGRVPVSVGAPEILRIRLSFMPSTPYQHFRFSYLSITNLPRVRRQKARNFGKIKAMPTTNSNSFAFRKSLMGPPGPAIPIPRSVWGPWKPTDSVAPCQSSDNPVPPPLPTSTSEMRFEWRLEKASKQYKPSLPSMAPGPFDPPIMNWRLYVSQIL